MARKFPNTSTIERGDRVLTDSGVSGTVVVDGYSRSLVEYAAAPETGCSTERDWFDNGQLHITARRKERLVGDEPKSVKVIK